MSRCSQAMHSDCESHKFVTDIQYSMCQIVHTSPTRFAQPDATVLADPFAPYSASDYSPSQRGQHRTLPLSRIEATSHDK
jgi:hypothetical protein